MVGMERKRQSEEIMGKSHDIIKKLDRPVLTKADVPYPAELVFNAGVCKAGGKYVMAFRNDYGAFDGKKFEGTSLGVAFSDDGIKWDVSEKLLSLRLPKTITVIEDNAFWKCSCLEHLYMPKGIRNISDEALKGTPPFLDVFFDSPR